MARPLRIEHPGAWYHVTARGNDRQKIFCDDRDRGHFIESLAEAVERFLLVLHAYVLMDNHYHLMVETPQAGIARAMHWLNVSHSVWFNRRHGRVGHLFQGHYKAILVEPEGWALSLSRYVHLNPIRLAALGLDKSAQRQHRLGLGPPPSPEVVRERLQRLRRFRWSSYRAYVGYDKAPPWLECQTILARVGHGSLRRRQQAYQDYIEDAVREGMPESPWEQLVAQVVLGGEEFVQRLRRQVKGDAQEQPSLTRLQERPRWDQVVGVVERLKGEPWTAFQDRHGDWGRDLALYLARKHTGMKLSELGRAAGGMSARAVSWAVRQAARRIIADKSWAQRAGQASRKIENLEIRPFRFRA